MKACSKCGDVKPNLDFYPNKKSPDGRSYWCKVCEKTYQKEAYPKNREQTLKRLRALQPVNSKKRLNTFRKRVYGVVPEDIDQIILNQGSRCAICQLPFEKTPSLDHDHITGKIRGVLCAACNTGMGLFKDSPERLRKAADYLERK